MRPNEITEAIIGASMNVHSALGAGMLEKTIETCLVYEFSESGLHFESQVRLPVKYKNVRLPLAYRVDFVVENCVILDSYLLASVSSVTSVLTKLICAPLPPPAQSRPPTSLSP